MSSRHHPADGTPARLLRSRCNRVTNDPGYKHAEACMRKNYGRELGERIQRAIDKDGRSRAGL